MTLNIGLISADFAPNAGGVAAHVVELGKALAKLSHNVHVITLPLGAEQAALTQWQGMQVHRPRTPKAQPFYGFFLHHWLKRFLTHTPLDVLHVHGLRPLQATRKLDCPVVFTNHTSGYLQRIERGPAAQRKVLKRLTHLQHVIAPSEELCAATQQVGYTGPVSFIANGIDTDVFHPQQQSSNSQRETLRQHWQVPDDHVVLLLTRRLVEKNGVKVFAEATQFLKDLPIRIIFAGDGPERQSIEDTITAYGLGEKTRFLGSVASQDIPALYHAADVAILPSLMEATSISGLEAMASGLPLVGTQVGGIPYLIDHQQTGLLVPPRQPQALAKAVAELISSREQRLRMGEAARLKAEQQFSWSTIAEQTINIYQSVITATETSHA